MLLRSCCTKQTVRNGRDVTSGSSTKAWDLSWGDFASDILVVAQYSAFAAPGTTALIGVGKRFFILRPQQFYTVVKTLERTSSLTTYDEKGDLKVKPARVLNKIRTPQPAHWTPSWRMMRAWYIYWMGSCKLCRQLSGNSILCAITRLIKKSRFVLRMPQIFRLFDLAISFLWARQNFNSTVHDIVCMIFACLATDQHAASLKLCLRLLLAIQVVQAWHSHRLRFATDVQFSQCLLHFVASFWNFKACNVQLVCQKNRQNKFAAHNFAN